MTDRGADHPPMPSAPSDAQSLVVSPVFLERVLAEAEIVGAICSLGQAMGLHVVAEGVETTTQRDRLRELGCHSAQGYPFGRPRAQL